MGRVDDRPTIVREQRSDGTPRGALWSGEDVQEPQHRLRTASQGAYRSGVHGGLLAGEDERTQDLYKSGIRREEVGRQLLGDPRALHAKLQVALRKQFHS
eukprot:1195402-Prorocentrum_minimum.AAC.2